MNTITLVLKKQRPKRKKRKRKKNEGSHGCSRNMGKLMMVGKMRKKIGKIKNYS